MNGLEYLEPVSYLFLNLPTNVHWLNEVPAELGLCHFFFFGSPSSAVFLQLYLWLLVCFFSELA